MKQRILLLLLLILSVLVVGCTDPADSESAPADPEPCRHHYEKTASQPATCLRKGSETYTCSACGDTYTDELAQKAHEFKDATCFDPKTCRNCPTTEGMSLGHSYDGVVCSRCSDVRKLYMGYVFTNWYESASNRFAPLNDDGTPSSVCVFENTVFCGDRLYEYFDEETYSYNVPETVILELIRDGFVYSDVQFAALKEDYAKTENEDDPYYADGMFHIPGSASGGFTPDYSHAIVGSVSRPGELTVYVEYAETDGFDYQKLSYYAVIYEYRGDAEFVVFGHHGHDNRITATDADTAASLRVKRVTELTSLPTEMTPAIQPTWVFTEYSYSQWEGEPWESDERVLSFRIYADESKPMEILETNIECCDSFRIDNYTVPALAAMSFSLRWISIPSSASGVNIPTGSTKRHL